MVRNLVKLALIVIACILIYNYFFGTNEEQNQSKVFFGKIRDVVVSGADILKSEKQKFDAGKYDRLLNQLGGAYKAVRGQAQHLDQKVMNRLDELEQRRQTLQSQLDTIQQNEQDEAPAATVKKGIRPSLSEAQQATKNADQQQRKEALQRELERLYQDSEQLLRQAQENK